MNNPDENERTSRAAAESAAERIRSTFATGTDTDDGYSDQGDGLYTAEDDDEDDAAPESSIDTEGADMEVESAPQKLTLETKSRKAIIREFKKLSKAEQEDYDQARMNLRRLLAFDPHKVYVDDDLNSEETLDRALSLLYRQRFGQKREELRISPHINYYALHPKVAEAVEKKVLELENVAPLREILDEKLRLRRT